MKIFLNPPPRFLKEVFETSPIYLFIQTIGTKFINLKIQFVLLYSWNNDGNFVCCLFNNTNISRRQSVLFRQWLSQSNNELVFFNYGTTIILLCQILKFSKLK